MSQLIIELRGVEFHNKGAELMLHAILDKVRQTAPDKIFVMETRESAPIHKQRELGIYTKMNGKKFGINAAAWGGVLPKSIRRNMGFVLEREINTIMDGSGFAFGDFWGPKKAGDRLADHIIKWKKEGKKVILLPQAFGAFTDPKLRNKMQVILDHADLVFARDKYSYEYLHGLEGKKTNIGLRPDFTNLIKGKLPDYFDLNKCEVAIIPNNKLLESSVFSNRSEYIDFLKDVCTLIKKQGKLPFFLIHEGVKDLRLAEEVKEMLSFDVPILKEDNPLYVKGIIGKVHAVITSRFHGLVSALAQAVPCLCVGWSHKYLALMEDYDYSEGLLQDDELKNSAMLERKINMILAEISASDIRRKLEKNGEQQKVLAGEMWDLVFKTIN